ncbi:aminopeptidase N [Sporichthya polymorpha]|uniref:aminopeptidase N n=1 Tax=Sporichthya polymorpha TaxID=35751 RepID=UPI0003798D87|nr:aminopeptidase N [Sporichthya polymorpha]
MPGKNLTRDEAAARAATVDVHSYAVELDLVPDPSGENRTFRSTTVVQFDGLVGRENGTFLDLIAPSVSEITLNGKALDPATHFDGTRVNLPEIAADNTLRVVADCAYMNTGEGLHRFRDPVDDGTYLYTQFEVADAKRVFACFDQPDLKATFQLTVLAPAQWAVFSNAETPEPRPVPGRDGSSVWVFDATPRMSTYIVALVAGDYHVERSEYRGPGDLVVPMAVACRRSLAEHLDADEIFDVTRKGFDFFLELFDQPYPFTKYDQLFVPEYNAGAMENAGCVTILEDYVFRSKVTDAAYERRAETILHELAHMWFGDLVTMKWWDDLWLNESFATYISVLCQSEATRWTNAWTTFANVEKTWAYRQDQLPSTHPIVADINDLDDVEVNFDGITYAKGASVLKQLVAWVGRDNFVSAIRTYFSRHAWGNTTLKDFLAALEETSGRNLSAWSAEWLQTSQVNVLRPVFELDELGAFRQFTVQQSAPEDYPTLRSHRIAIGLYELVDGKLSRRDRVELDVAGASTEVKELIGKRAADLVLVNDDDLTYAKIRLDPASLATLGRHIGDIAESLPRALCWSAAWDMTRDAELPARDYVDLVLRGIGSETGIVVQQALQRQAISALFLFADPGYREPGLSRFAAAALEHLRAAEPGSDSQLAWARTFASVARTNEQLDLLAALLAGEPLVPGLAMDVDLRWHMLHRLVSRGVAGESEIDAELDRDDTAAGQRHAAGALAARPTVQAKEEAWASVVGDDKLPNAMQNSIIGGFVQIEQGEILEQFVEPYFEAVPRIWEERTNEIAQNIVNGFYPSWRISADTVERTDRFLAENSPAPALRRLLTEARDGVQRALRAQECDRAAG